MGKLVRRLMTGYEDVAEWTPGDAASYQAAQDALEQHMKSGYNAVTQINGRNEPVTHLPEDAELVILTTAMGAG